MREINAINTNIFCKYKKQVSRTIVIKALRLLHCKILIQCAENTCIPRMTDGSR